MNMLNANKVLLGLKLFLVQTRQCRSRQVKGVAKQYFVRNKKDLRVQVQ